MEEWKEYRLDTICNLSAGGDAPRNAVKKPIGDMNIPIYSNGESEKGLYGYTNTYKIEAPAVTISARGNIGFVCYRKENFVPIVRLITAKANEQIVSNEYLYYCLCNTHIWGDGSVQKQLTVPMISGYFVKVPSLTTQYKIVSILKSLDDKIEVNRRINENLEQQAQALFKSWFVDFEPFKDGEFVESELGMIPKGWRVGRIYDQIEVIYGAPYKSSLFNDNKEGLPLIRIRDLKTNAPQFYTPEILPNTEYIEAGDIVAGMDAEFTPYIWLGEKGVLNQRCCKFKAKEPSISNYYILFLVKPELEYVQSYKTGTTVSHLGKSDIDRFLFVTPPLDVLAAFSEIVNPLKEEVVNRATESRRLASLRDTLLPRLMSGELTINDIGDSL